MFLKTKGGLVLNNKNLIKIAHFLNKIDKIAVVCHKNPDGDALGAVVALCLALHKLNKHCKFVSYSHLPNKFEFLFKNVYFEKFKPEFYIAVDLASSSLLEMQLRNEKIDLVIDHHRNNSVKSKLKLINFKAASTCEIVFELLKFMNIKINKTIATSLYVGIVSDTGCFKFSNTTFKTHKIAASLIKTGINFSKINFELFDVKTMAQIQLQIYALQNLKLKYGGCCALVTINKSVFEQTKCSESDFFVVVDALRNLKNVEVAIAIKQISINSFKVSVRTTKKHQSALNFCEKFNGGGHFAAAGFEISGSVNEIEKIILDTAGEFFFGRNSLCK